PATWGIDSSIQIEPARHRVKFISVSSGFVVSLSLRSFRATQKAFTVEQNPGDSMFCCFRLARIVSTDAVIQILTRTYVASSVVLTLQNVTIKHSSAVRGSYRGERI